MRRQDHEERSSFSRNTRPSLRPPPRSSSYASNPPASWSSSAADSPRRMRSSRRRWPPSPSVEDEASSLAKEFGGFSPQGWTSEGSEACMRGEIDQEPLMLDVDTDSDNQNPERRFVLVNNLKGTASSNANGRDARGNWRGGTKHNARLDPEDDDVPIYTRRQPSPYTISNPQNRLSGEYVLAEHVLSSSPGRTSSQAPFKSSTWSSASSTKSSGIRTPAEAPSRESLGTEDKYESRDGKQPRGVRFSSDYANVQTSTRLTQSRPATEKSTSGRRATYDDASSSEPAYIRQKASPVPSPTGSPAASPSLTTKEFFPARPRASSNLKTATSHLRSNSRQNSPLASPVTKDEHWDPSFNQRPSPRPSSPSSNLEGRPVNTPTLVPQLDTNALNQRPNVSLGSSIPSRADIPPAIAVPRNEVPPYPSGSGTTPLPYPDDHMSSLMPAHESFTSPIEPTAAPFIVAPAINMPTPSNASNQYLSDPATRPPALVPAGMAPPSPNLDSQGLLPTEVRRTESRSPARPATTSLPRCPRGEFSSRYDDWYILDSFPEFDVCPSCLDQIIDRTMPELCRYFKRAPRRPSGTATRCDFNNPWVRLAWLLTLQNSRPKIDLLDDVAHIYASGERCPGESEVSGSWYGLLDGDRLIGDFAVCPVDRKVLETLFPSLKGQFTRLSTSDPRRRRCATRVGSRWYAALLDAFVEMDSKAGSRSGKVDLKPLLELLRTTSASSTSSSSASSSTNHPPQTPDPSPKCARDTLVLNRHWHIIPSLPELTVCPTCYADVIRPALHSGSRLASSFTRTPLLLPDPSLSSSVFFRPPSSTQGASCQLYSPRMRRVWAKAVAGGDDFEYLARRARERRKVEAAVQGQHASLVRLMEQRGREAVSPRLAEERFEREWKEVLREWKEWE